MKKFLHFLGGTCALVMACFLAPQAVLAQVEDDGPFAEAGVTIGPSNFLGDLGGRLGKGTTFLKDNNFQLTKVSFGLHYSYYPKQWLGARIAVNFGKLEGDDKIINGKGGLEEARLNRGLDFQSNFMEAILVGEVYPTVFLEEDPNDLFHKLRPYGVIGVGVFHFNPKGIDPATGQLVELRPLHLEGQGFAEYPDRKQFSLWQPNVPLGVGVKYWLSDNVTLSLEVIHRKTFTDYIDGVSTTYIDKSLFAKYLSPAQAALAARMYDKSNNGAGGAPDYGQPGQKRGDPSQKDGYYTFGFKLGFRLSSGDGYRNSTRCPVIRF
ncbi:MAG: hypothetical protein KGO82_10770 [Bacteroidota bacterium]|nr:hypothetical protein [Bacteroidota bacterium]